MELIKKNSNVKKQLNCSNRPITEMHQLYKKKRNILLKKNLKIIARKFISK